MKISVVIPTLNEESHIEKTLLSVIKQEGDYELYVVDGGSSDNTVAIARKYACVINSQLGRANQMNAGAIFYCFCMPIQFCLITLFAK